MNEMTLRARYATFVLSSVIGTLFAIVIALLMFANLVRSVPDPLTTTQYVAFREQLRAEPDNESRKAAIRELDLSLRNDYFRRRQFAIYGSYLLLGGIVIAVAAAKAAARLHRRLPQRAAPESWADATAQLARQSLYGVTGLAAVLAVAAIGLRFSHHTLLTADLPQLAVAKLAPDSMATGKRSEPDGPAVPPVSESAGAESPSEPKPELSPTKEHPRPEPDAETATPAATAKTPEAVEYARQWPRFRGPLGSGISATADMAIQWDVASGKGIAWKSAVPLHGNSSPIVWADAVIVTGGDEQQREVYCFEADSGELRWKWTGPPNEANAEPLEISEDTGYAASTAVTDGVHIYAMFTNGDLVALDLAGKQVWIKRLGPPKNSYGHASSPIIADGKLLLQFDQGGRNDKLSKLLALNLASGETVWETLREVPNSWSTPLVVDHAGQLQIITCADPWVIAYNVQDGKEIWRTKSLRQDVGPSPVAAGELVYAANEFPGISAIRLGGQGDVTDSHVAWFADIGVPDTCSPLVFKDLLLLQASFGTLSCYDAQKGEEPLWEEEFDENFHSSPGLAGDYVYLFSESGKSWVVRAAREKCERISENDLGEKCVTSPAFANERIYIRGEEHLFCLKKE